MQPAVIQSVVSKIATTQPQYSQITSKVRVNVGVLSSPQTLLGTPGMSKWVPSQINMEMSFGHIPSIQQLISFV